MLKEKVNGQKSEVVKEAKTQEEEFIVEGRKLDTQQMACVRELYHNHLVVAGAGTGKTTTIIGKLKWLLKAQKFRPEEILVLSFTNASAAEMRERIIAETRENITEAGKNIAGTRKDTAKTGKIIAETSKNVTACTFHKLGLEIVKSVKPETKITRTSFQDFVAANLSEDMKPLLEQVVQIGGLMRMNNVKATDVLNSRKWEPEEVQIIEAAGEMIEKYEEALRKAGEIDFSDMINLAREYVEAGKYHHQYKFVVVDEYQDISLVRFNLLLAMRKSADYDLFCVGDDWQAIYRFAGSEVDLILNFEKHWGETVISKIETTYRFPQTLADASGKFVMENFLQITKKVKALPDPRRPMLNKRGEVVRDFRGRERSEVDFAITEVAADSVLQSLQYARRVMSELPEGASVYFLGRYTRDMDFLRLIPGFKISREEDELAGTLVGFAERPDITVRFLTVHKSKGLQADYVFVMNMVDGQMGFPSRVESSAISEFLHGVKEKYPDAEERRLFYVAMTRAKKKLYLLTVHGHKSDFVVELEDLLYRKMPVVEIGMLEG